MFDWNRNETVDPPGAIVNTEKMLKKTLKKDRAGLVLVGGGARAAYQAGVLRGISDILSDFLKGGHAPFRIYCGDSGGAINALCLAQNADSFERGTQTLWHYWKTISSDNVIRTDPSSLLKIGSGWLRDLTIGGVLGSSHAVHLLDTTPLQNYLRDRIDFGEIHRRVALGEIRGVSIAATNYATGTAISFFDADPEVQGWARTNRIGVRTILKLPHLMASSAIPIFFPPVEMNGSYYCDGAVRLRTPLSPAIHLGADRVLAIGLRHLRSEQATMEMNQTARMSQISLVDIAGVLLNASFLDNLDSDLERMARINQTISMMPSEVRSRHATQLRMIPLHAVRPSKDLGTMASEQFEHFPKMLKFMFKGIGASREKGWDLLSYLAFDSTYTRKLLDIGYRDAFEDRENLINFFTE